jgi:hypothetical protein
MDAQRIGAGAWLACGQLRILTAFVGALASRSIELAGGALRAVDPDLLVSAEPGQDAPPTLSIRLAPSAAFNAR